jgi:hypothetical protein
MTAGDVFDLTAGTGATFAATGDSSSEPAHTENLPETALTNPHGCWFSDEQSAHTLNS